MRSTTLRTCDRRTAAESAPAAKKEPRRPARVHSTNPRSLGTVANAAEVYLSVPGARVDLDMATLHAVSADQQRLSSGSDGTARPCPASARHDFGIGHRPTCQRFTTRAHRRAKQVRYANLAPGIRSGSRIGFPHLRRFPCNRERRGQSFFLDLLRTFWQWCGVSVGTRRQKPARFTRRR